MKTLGYVREVVSANKDLNVALDVLQLTVNEAMEINKEAFQRNLHIDGIRRKAGDDKWPEQLENDRVGDLCMMVFANAKAK